MTTSFMICIIDDDDIYRFMIKKYLEAGNTQQELIAFTDGEQAMNYIMENKKDRTALPDVIFLDLNMPIMDGFQFVEAFALLKSELEKEIKIFMVSSSINPEDMEKARSYPEISEYLIKPLGAEKLQRLVERLQREKTD